jgi:hypothetical protein
MNPHMLNAMGVNGAFPWDELTRLCTLAALGVVAVFLVALVLEGLSAAFEDDAQQAAPALARRPTDARAPASGLWAPRVSAAGTPMLAAVGTRAQREPLRSQADPSVQVDPATQPAVVDGSLFDPSTIARLEFVRWRVRRGMLSEHPSG